MKTVLALIGISIAAVVLASGCISDQPIGGERDEYGCLVAAGYSFDSDVNACTRDWELDVDQKRAAKIAVAYLGYEKGLTALQVETWDCTGCFSVLLERGKDRVYCKALRCLR